jgi:hypothetical protein
VTHCSGVGAPRAPLGPPSAQKCCVTLCHVAGSLIPEFWEAWAEFPEGVSQFSKQIGTAEPPGGPAAREGGARWGLAAKGTEQLPLAPPRAAQPGRDKQENQAQRGQGTPRRLHSGPGFRSRFALPHPQPQFLPRPEASLLDEAELTGRRFRKEAGLGNTVCSLLNTSCVQALLPVALRNALDLQPSHTAIVLRHLLSVALSG